MHDVREIGEVTYVPDASVITNGVLKMLVRDGRVQGRLVLLKELIDYFESLAKNGKSLGVLGLEEMRFVRAACASKGMPVDVVSSGRRADDVDALIRWYALEAGVTLVTSSKTQQLASEALGVNVLYVEPPRSRLTTLEKFFSDGTMSVHLKEGAPPHAKQGRPGRWRLVQLSETPLSREEVEAIADEILEVARTDPDAVIEIERPNSIIIQMSVYRIIIARPPMSDGWEITAVRPLVRPKLEDYTLAEKLMRRLEEKAEGILIAGAPGMGKTTFAQALAEYYKRKSKVVKTIESPRDMHLPPEVTQYSKTYATPDELHDILLLSRPDYTVFDELRTDNDFKLYVDLRLAGIGMIGVVHATSPIDALQRFIGRIDLGMIPSVVDTVLFLEEGEVRKVYDVSMSVKLPTGLREADLARPVIEVRDFLSGQLEYEMYTFGEQTVVVPVKHVVGEGLEAAVRKAILTLLPSAEVTFDGGVVTVTVPREEARSARKLKRRLSSIERKYGVVISLKLV
ncbi:MAG: ATPase, T2SS/T4P/T4SS family [Zestosphaera sp.]